MFEGTACALISPFTKEGHFDEKSFEKLLFRQIESKTKAIVVCGTTAESFALESHERQKALEMAVSVCSGRIPVIAGCSSNITKDCRRKIKQAKKIGVDAALVLTPYYNKPSAQGCLQHFQEASREDLPMILYYHPMRTACHLSLEEIRSILALPLVQGIKDCSRDPLLCMAFRDEKISFFVGDDDLILPYLSLGAQGSISVIANIVPDLWADLFSLFQKGSIEKAQTSFAKVLPLLKLLFSEGNPTGVKAALALMGLCENRLSLPLLPMSSQAMLSLEKEMRRLLWI